MSIAATRRILITRPREDAEPLAALLAEHGIDSLIEPLMLAEILAGETLDLAGVQALIATSANGVRAFAARDPCRSIPVCCVGDATARAAREAGFADVSSAAGDVEALAEMIVGRHDPADGAFLHIAGTVTAGDLAGRLQASGFAYRRAVLYEMRPAAGPVSGGLRGPGGGEAGRRRPLFAADGGAVRGPGRRSPARCRLREPARLLPEQSGRREGRAPAVRRAGRCRASGPAGDAGRHSRRCCSAILKLRIPAGYVSPTSGDPC